MRPAADYELYHIEGAVSVPQFRPVERSVRPRAAARDRSVRLSIPPLPRERSRPLLRPAASGRSMFKKVAFAALGMNGAEEVPSFLEDCLKAGVE